MAKFSVGDKAVLIAHSKYANHGIIPLNSVVTITHIGFPGNPTPRDYGVSPGDGIPPSGCDEWQLRKLPPEDTQDHMPEWCRNIFKLPQANPNIQPRRKESA